MKKLLLLLIVAAFAKNAVAQIPSNCNAPATLLTNYDRDIKHVALQRIYFYNSPYIDSIDIPNAWQDTVAEGMAAIFNISSLNARDSVFDNYCIHQDINYVYTTIYVEVDTSYAWTHNWQSLNTTTGIPVLDNLLTTYGFSVVYYSSFTNLARLSTSQHINALPFCDSLSSFAGVTNAEPQSLMGDGNRVEYTKTGSDRFYDFSVGYGDCPSGCTSRLYFKFKVDAACSVTYLGRMDYNNPPDVCPAPWNCNITATALHEYHGDDIDFTAFPNPATHHITIATDHSDLKDAEVDLIDLLGKKVSLDASGISPDGHSMVLNTEKLERGVYFLEIFRGEKVRKVIKIVKE